MSARGRRAAARKRVLTSAAVSEARPQLERYVIWDARLIGFGLRVSPGGAKSFFIQYRTGEGRRTEPMNAHQVPRHPAAPRMTSRDWST